MTVLKLTRELGEALLSTLALISYFLRWHLVQHTSGSLTLTSGGPALAAIEERNIGLPQYCTGLAHYDGNLTIPLLVAAHVMLAVWTRKSQSALVMAMRAALLVLVLVYCMHLKLLSHVLSRVDVYVAERLFYGALQLAIGLAAVRGAWALLPPKLRAFSLAKDREK